ncbi:PSD1 and planctomycete cytochrome C domain-containing protein [Luteolibacter algae]|uniref:PSD1 and planctomycete cytochrome C domain-containing protein n=1 Tax=Luteolibacter algae TaxID=454151 RepID=A0ABW5D8M7_9BACT
MWPWTGICNLDFEKLSEIRGVDISVTLLPMKLSTTLPETTLAVPMVAAFSLLSAASLFSQSAILDPVGVEFFESKIRPMLAEHCYKCHSQDSEKVKGGLLLDTREASLRGGDTGAAVVPGDLGKSLLITAISYHDDSLQMPPKYQLEDSVIEDFRKWIEMGAPDPREPEDSDKITSTIDIAAGREFWAYRKPEQRKVPEFPAESWPVTDIDSFIYSALREAKLEPVADADPATLLRRLYFDIIGLPPKPAQVEAFIKSCAEDQPAAVAAVVDELLDSPQFGERWGRHWLDIARYAESNGRDANIVFYPQAWRYRDYVINSFNDDKPYDIFLCEQIAGDQMTSPDNQRRAEQIIGTGFLAIGPKNLNAKSEEQFRADLVDEQIDTLGKAMLGTTISCARCHDHKFDPIPQSDYYSMAGIFQSSDTKFGTYSSVQNRHASELIQLPIQESEFAFKPLSPAEMQAKENKLRIARESINEIKGELFRARQSGKEGPDPTQRRKLLQLNHLITMLETELKTYDKAGNPIALAMGVADSETISDAKFLVRGEVGLAKNTVPRGFLQVLSGEEAMKPLSDEVSGRLELAQWIASPENPLAARVMVNRVWMHLMGNGIVTSVDNFGATGNRPSHPELLDHLALQFINCGWSVKHLIREIVLSRTYQLSSDFDNAAFNIDPDNALHWRANRRRLDAESLRDSILAISGNLDLEPPYGSVITEQSLNLRSGGSADILGFEAKSPHRSVYLPIVRNQVPASLSIFDFADPSMSVGKRETTTVPSQALFLMNSDFVLKQSEAMAQRLIDHENLNHGEEVTTAFYHVYGRPPSEEEMRKANIYFKMFLEMKRQEPRRDRDADYHDALSTFCQSLFASADFLYLK